MPRLPRAVSSSEAPRWAAGMLYDLLRCDGRLERGAAQLSSSCVAEKASSEEGQVDC